MLNMAGPSGKGEWRSAHVGPPVERSSRRVANVTVSGELRDVEAGYGPFRALFGVSLSIPAGNVVAVLGANGAGTSTIARLVSGLIPITAGTVLFDGVDIRGMKPWRIATLRIVQAPEGRSVFSSLTTLLLIEQYVGHALAFADSVVLLQHGKVMYDGTTADLGDVVERFPPTSPS